MRHLFVALMLLTAAVTSAVAQVSVGIGISVPGVRIGINLPAYPELAPVPGYPVYYAPGLSLNFFFYDGLYWVYYGDNWYASSWYNGPWNLVEPLYVPVFILRIPVRYYRAPPPYFQGWRRSAPPHWGEHWGGEWEQHRSGWNKWNRSGVPVPAPLPLYQRQYSGEQYPHAEQQQQLQREHYPYQPRDTLVRERYRQPERTGQQPAAPSPQGQPGAPRQSGPGPQGMQRSAPPPPMRREERQQSAPGTVPAPQRGPATQMPEQRFQRGDDQREMQVPGRGPGPERPRER
jgi:hypothetical protein